VRVRCRLIGTLRAAGRSTLVSLWSVNLLHSVLPTATGLATGLLVSRLVTAPHDGPALVALTLTIGGLVLATQTVEIASSALRVTAARRVDSWHRAHLAELVARPPGIAHLEEPSIQDELALAVMKGLPGWVGYTFGSGAVGQLVIVTRTAGACLAAVVLARFSWPLAVGLLGVALFIRASSRKEWLAQHAVVRELAPTTRRAAYWAEVAAAPWSAKELRVFGLGDWVVDRFRGLMVARTERLAAVRTRLLRRLNRMFVLLVVITTGGLAVLAAAAATGRISTGALAVYLGAFWGVVAISRWDWESFDVEFAGLPTLHAVDRLAQRVGAAVVAPPGALARTSTAAPLIRFEGVGFGYPGASRPVLDGVDLEIAPGELLALVGVNGAGKTTLTKLLAGLYQPTTGRITVDGTDLADIDPSAWRDRISVVLQEFTRYELSIRDNVALGAACAGGDQELLDLVARKAGVTGLVARAPHGWDTPLARAYTGGIDLSGGQWQRIAIARALYAVACGARLLVLDEPTAHLDVSAERDVFDRIIREADGAGILLISHRLSTVRQADRIVLLDGGRVTENGSHHELIARGGDYARLFALQADRFDDVLPDDRAVPR
jgi:ATP-binding cassette subfamily B protein